MIEDEEVAWGEERGEIANGEVGDFASGAADKEESGGVAGVGGGGGDSVVGDSDGEEVI